MRRRTLLIAAAFLGGGLSLAAGLAGVFAATHGEWTINNWTLGEGMSLSLTHRTPTSRSQWTCNRSIAELEGLTREQLHAVHAPVAFRLRGDAGSFVFEGTLTLGVGRGTFHFEPNPAFTAQLAALGYDAPGDDDLFGLAMREISLAYATEVKRLEPGTTLRDPIRFRDHGVELDEIREVLAVGDPRLSGTDVVDLHDHGVPPSFVRALKTFGYPSLAADNVIALHDHGVDERYVKGLAASGMRGLEPDDVIRLHDHGVETRYIARIREAGFTDLTVEQIVRLHDHGVD